MRERVEVKVPEFETECQAYLSFWYKQEGEEVTAGEDLVEFETDKAAVTVEAPATGKLAQIFVGEDEEITSGQVVGIIEAI
ncbi:MAG TPA: dihydrolipoyllysine succinyltransferase [Armatimonadetes bacterium]|nr:dihydrolipoyllysine succinyltransferase [Armatimonadota bacterium]